MWNPREKLWNLGKGFNRKIYHHDISDICQNKLLQGNCSLKKNFHWLLCFSDFFLYDPTHVDPLLRKGGYHGYLRLQSHNSNDKCCHICERLKSWTANFLANVLFPALCYVDCSSWTWTRDHLAYIFKQITPCAHKTANFRSLNYSPLKL